MCIRDSTMCVVRNHHTSIVQYTWHCISTHAQCHMQDGIHQVVEVPLSQWVCSGVSSQGAGHLCCWFHPEQPGHQLELQCSVGHHSETASAQSTVELMIHSWMEPLSVLDKSPSMGFLWSLWDQLWAIAHMQTVWHYHYKSFSLASVLWNYDLQLHLFFPNLIITNRGLACTDHS